jgi:Ctr copper transporter family
MLFTWNTENLCVIFRQWQVTGPLSLAFTLIGVAALTAGYELVREMSRRYETRVEKALQSNIASKPPSFYYSLLLSLHNGNGGREMESLSLVYEHHRAQAYTHLPGQSTNKAH